MLLTSRRCSSLPGVYSAHLDVQWAKIFWRNSRSPVCVYCRALVKGTPNKIILGIVRRIRLRVSVFRPHNWYFCQHRHGCDAWTMERNRYIEWKLMRLCVCDDWFEAMVVCLNANTFHIPRIITMYACTLIGTSQRTRQTHNTAHWNTQIYI